MASLTAQSRKSLDARFAGAKAARYRQSPVDNASPYSRGVYGYRGGNDERYYSAYRDVPYTAIRPIAVRFAGQPVRVATIPRRRTGKSRDHMHGVMTKALKNNGLIATQDDHAFTQRQKAFRHAMPTMMQKGLPPDAVTLDAHPFIEAMDHPNDHMESWATKFCVAASLMTCGKALLLWDNENLTEGTTGEASASVYYCPMHWATPSASAGPTQRWDIKPSGGGISYTAERGEFAYFRLPDPRDPFGAISPMIASAKRINTSDKITEAHQAGLNNLINPSYAVVAGQIFTNSGDQRRARLSASQRKEITNRIKSYVSGAARNGEPIVLDALIEDIRSLGTTPREVDFVEGHTLSKDAIMEAYGTSPIVTGHSQNANRAGSNTAHEIFYDLVVNPLLLQSGQTLTHYIGPLYHTDAYSVVLYHEEARIEDADAQKARVALGRQFISPVEFRQYMRTGRIDWTDEDYSPPTETNTRTIL